MYKIIIQGPTGRQKIEAESYLLVTQTKKGSSRALSLDANTYAGLDENPEVAVESLHALGEQMSTALLPLEAQIMEEQVNDVPESESDDDEGSDE